MKTICGADCSGCSFRERCKGCEASCGSPFGGGCVAAEHILAGGKEEYARFKGMLLGELNGLLRGLGLPEAEALHELPGFFINLPFPLPGGGEARFLSDGRVYLGTQIAAGGGERCIGAAADGDFLLVCSYGAEGADPALLAFVKRSGPGSGG